MSTRTFPSEQRANEISAQAAYGAACARLGRTVEELVMAEAMVATLRRQLAQAEQLLDAKEEEIVSLGGRQKTGGGEDGSESADDPVGYTAAVGQAD